MTSNYAFERVYGLDKKKDDRDDSEWDEYDDNEREVSSDNR